MPIAIFLLFSSAVHTALYQKKRLPVTQPTNVDKYIKEMDGADNTHPWLPVEKEQISSIYLCDSVKEATSS